MFKKQKTACTPLTDDSKRKIRHQIEKRLACTGIKVIDEEFYAKVLRCACEEIGTAQYKEHREYITQVLREWGG